MHEKGENLESVYPFWLLCKGKYIDFVSERKMYPSFSQEKKKEETILSNRICYT